MVRASNKRKRSNTLEPVLITIDPPFSEYDAFRQSLIRLYDDQLLCDVKFEVRGHTFLAHKLVLVAANSFLGTMITSGMSESNSNQITLDVDPQLFRSILNYIYGKSIEIPSTSIVALLSLCNSYCMMGLRDRLAIILSQHLSIDNCCTILHAGDCYNCEILLDCAKQLLYNNFLVISKTEGFLELPSTVMRQILSSDEILDCDEVALFDILVRWVEFQPQEREEYCDELLQCIRFPLMNSAYLSEVIKHHPLLTKSFDRMNLVFEAFEHHALVACGRPGLINSLRTRKRKQSCSFTRYSSLRGHEDAVSAILLLGEYIITGSWDATLKIWKQEMIEPTEVPTSSAFPDSLSNTNTNTNTDASPTSSTTNTNHSPGATWVVIATLDDHAGAIRSLCQCQGKLISCSDDGSIKVWEPETWECVCSMEGHDGATNCVIDCLGRLASGGDDGTIKLWGSMNNWLCEVTVHNTILATGPLPGQPPLMQPDGDNEELLTRSRVGVISMTVYEDKLISGGDDAIVRIWNMNSWVCERILRGHTDEIWTLKVWNHALYTGSVDGTVRVWRRHWVAPSSSSGSSVATTTYSSNGSTALLPRTATDDTISSILSSSHSIGQLYPSHSSHPLANAAANPYDWSCEAIIRCDNAVYTICCFENKLVTAGASNRISIWKPAPAVSTPTVAPHSSRGGSNSTVSNENWTLYKWLDTDDDGVWCMDMGIAPYPLHSSASAAAGGSSSGDGEKGTFVSGGCDGVIRVWQ